ncbi:MAG TPA: HAD family phosphatase [Candidatus Bipolaricaulis anaerobius]|nr:HAD family phosphatase [Candidatus Bipolaricaulis sp.]MDD3748212.1 HAD family phosphatase [Candidatus Bipolaricaulis anaerobius]MDD5764142.1 HAD family phosphatase [Candidatus Bipolaricaulis anaerobius]HNR24867.1 HAD family phosphatase [Candidatus Bipolaricaulis anaerobius]HNS24220.1 HAD family phosphatase [Candidatus Bipolaricaulis anaerobius]
MIRAVLFDLDGTLVRYHGVAFESSWGALGVAAGVGEPWDDLLAHYRGRLEEYPDWVRENASLLRGVPLARVEEALFPPPYAPGAREAVAELKEAGYVLGIVSSGVSLVADRVREELGLAFAIANELLVANGRFTGEAVVRVGLGEKRAVVEQEARQRGLSLGEIAFVGDHLNDIPVFAAVGYAIAYAPKEPEVARAAHAVVDHFRSIPELVRAAS